MKHKIKTLCLIMGVTCIFPIIFSCSKAIPTLQDGNYIGLSKQDSQGSYAKVILNISNSKISKVDFQTIQKNGQIKDADYGKVNGKIVDSVFYQKAQIAVKSTFEYQKKLEKEKDLSKVDVISGATITYGQFRQAVNNALNKASK